MRILFVAMPESIHAVRWITQLTKMGWDIQLFPSTDGELHTGFRDITYHSIFCRRPKIDDPSVKIHGMIPIWRGRRTLLKVMERAAPKMINRADWLARTIRKFKPDIIHSLEIQHAGYMVMEAKKQFLEKEFPPWIVTSWGNDIFFFGRLKNDIPRIREVLANCQYYDCECQRDVVLARSFGFTGKVLLPVIPNTGGFDIEMIKRIRQPGPTSKRRVIALKGYQGWAGRALNALRAIELCSQELHGYRVEIYLAHPDVQMAAELVTFGTGIPFDIIPYSSHEEILKMHGRARISIGVNITDGVSTSFLEAFVMGSFPIQASTACVEDWIEDGITGMIVHPEDPQMIADAIRRAIKDDELVDSAAKVNFQIAIERLDRKILEPIAAGFYEEIAKECGIPL